MICFIIENIFIFAVTNVLILFLKYKLLKLRIMKGENYRCLARELKMSYQGTIDAMQGVYRCLTRDV